MSKIPELLAPAGGEAQLRAAVQSGADSVYMGGYNFNARQSAKNFTPEQMREMIDYCHIYGVKTHIAVNTLIKEKELPELLDYAKGLNDMGADALIIQDIGAAEMIHTVCPEMELHASTQMTVTSLEGVRYLEDMGFSRVVLARELSKAEIEYICKRAKAEIEVFVHGAICQCYSGQCLMSSILGGRSGNRGRCAQPCRLQYSITGKNEFSGYFLSPKDMALINELEELKNIGVASLKIEGRLKRPEYVSAVTGIYRKYLDFPSKISAADMDELKNAFSRSGFTNGYFTGKIGSAMMSKADQSNQQNSFTPEAKARAAEGADFRKIPVNISAYLTEGEPIQITIYDNDGNCAVTFGTTNAQPAINRPLDAERLEEQLAKLGGTPFAAETITAEINGNITVPIKDINNARRQAVTELINQRKIFDKRIIKEFKLPQSIIRQGRTPKLTASVKTIEQAEAVISSGIDIIYAPPKIAARLTENYPTLKIVTDTGSIFEPEEILGDTVLVSSNGATSYYADKRLRGDFRLNIFNSLSAQHYSNFESITLSPELNLGELGAILKHTDVAAEVIGYGRLPLMIMKNCPLKAANKCQGKKNESCLKDRKNEEFPIICGKNCVCELINSKPIYMADKLNDLISKNVDYIRLMFTIESAAECGSITELYKKALNGENVGNPFGENNFTRGHFYRGTL